MARGSLKDTARRLRSILTRWIPQETLPFLEELRLCELDVVTGLISPCRILEIGAGSGRQARALQERGFRVSAIDIPSSEYRADRAWPVSDYDGRTLPYDDGAFDTVFSSNVLEHVPHAREFQEEIGRVLRPGGLAVHVVPSASWRFWTIITHFPRYMTFPGAHGVHSGSAFAELSAFRRRRWEAFFRETGWRVLTRGSTGLFYTGNQILGPRLDLKTRRLLSRFLGSSCHVFVLSRVLAGDEKAVRAVEGPRETDLETGPQTDLGLTTSPRAALP